MVAFVDSFDHLALVALAATVVAVEVEKRYSVGYLAIVDSIVGLAFQAYFAQVDLAVSFLVL